MAKMARKISGPKKELKAAIEQVKKSRKASPSLHQKELARMSGATAAKAASLKQQERYAKGKPMKLSKIGAAGAKAERRTLKSFK